MISIFLLNLIIVLNVQKQFDQYSCQVPVLVSETTPSTPAECKSSQPSHATELYLNYISGENQSRASIWLFMDVCSCAIQGDCRGGLNQDLAGGPKLIYCTK